MKYANVKLFRNSKTPLQTACLLIFFHYSGCFACLKHPELSSLLPGTTSTRTLPAETAAGSVRPEPRRADLLRERCWKWKKKMPLKSTLVGSALWRQVALISICTLKWVLAGEEFEVLTCSFTVPSCGCLKCCRIKSEIRSLLKLSLCTRF